MGGLFTALSVALVGFFGSQYLNQRQADDTNVRLYTEIMSSREAADASLRRQMFDSIISTFLDQETVEEQPAEQVLALELLAYNFHEALDLAPLFMHVDAQIVQAIHNSAAGTEDSTLDALQRRLARVARNVTSKQLAALAEAGAIKDQLLFFEDVDADPAGKSLFDGLPLGFAGSADPADQMRFSLWALDYSKTRREVKVRLAVQPSTGGEELVSVFWVGFYDFPMINNTRLQSGNRAAVVLRQWADDSAVLALAYFPGSHASLKEKPFYDEMIEDLRGAAPRVPQGADREDAS